MTTAPPKVRRGLERRVADLYDFSLDIARYDADVAFAAEGGVIYYVFDENICELFVSPADNYQYVMYESDFRMPTKGERTDRELSATQSALLIGEALFTGNLPGQRSGLCYITEWHRWEALERVSEFLSAITRIDGKAIGESMELALRAKSRLVGADEGELRGSDSDPMLHEDLEALKLESDLDGEIVKRRFAIVREATLCLAQDRRSEPVQQTNRLLRANKLGQLQNVTNILSMAHSRRSAPLEKEGRLAKSAGDWANDLKDEIRAAAARHHAKFTKGKTAIWNDARSLALIESISRELDPKTERIVFVTGDPTLFDVYRREYEKNPEEAKSGVEPFLLRRPLQYSTLFAPGDRGTSAIRRKLFYSLQQLVELPLAPFRVATVGDDTIPAEVLFRRHSLTLARIGSPTIRHTYFHDVWRTHGHECRDEKIEEVERQIEKAERILNGLSGDLVELRILEADRGVLKAASGKDNEERDRLIANYVEGALEALMRSALAIWRPEAESFFRRAAQEGPKMGGRRVPLAVHLSDSDLGSASPLMRMLDVFLEDPIEEGSAGLPVTFQVNSSFEIFVGAGAIALHANQWRLGDHFCEVAINAFTYFAKYEGIGAQDAAEAHYLCALAKRFRLGEIRPGENLDAYGPATKLYARATELLRSSEELTGQVGKGFASYRAYSERAALSLFYALFCETLATRLDGVKRQQEVSEAGVKAFRDAGACLAEALKIETRSGFGDLRPELHGSHTNRLRLQVLINIAAWHALAPILDGREGSVEHPALARECIRSLSGLEAIVTRASTPLFALDLLAFKISQEIDVEANRRRLASLSDRDNRDAVALDRTVFGLIKSYWSQSAAT